MGKRGSRGSMGARADKAEVLLPLYREKGESFFPYLNGFFHGLIIDRGTTDHPVQRSIRHAAALYHEEPEALYFASEAKSILAIRPGLRAFDLKGLGEWLSCGAVLENRSLFQGIDVLPGGPAGPGGPALPMRKAQYFSPESLGEPAAARAGGFLLESASGDSS